jgi:hypothetical protein
MQQPLLHVVLDSGTAYILEPHLSVPRTLL